MSAWVLLLHLSLLSIAGSEDLSECPKGFVEGEDSKCYKIFTEKKPWLVADTKCQKEDSHLAIIESTTDIGILKELINVAKVQCSAFWIAGKRACKGKCFAWLYWDGSRKKMKYTNWRPGEPNNYQGNEDCVLLHQDLTWDDAPCDDKYCYLCQIKV